MAIKYYHVPEQKKTIAVLTGTSMDANNKIRKMMKLDDENNPALFVNISKYCMPDKFRAVVVCSEDDEYSKEAGEKFAKEKLLEKYYSKFDEAIEKFIYDMTYHVSCFNDASDKICENHCECC